VGAKKDIMANRGISIEHDGRFGKQERKLMATLKFPEQFSKKIDMKKVLEFGILKCTAPSYSSVALQHNGFRSRD
jgi:hypothetical protein